MDWRCTIQRPDHEPSEHALPGGHALAPAPAALLARQTVAQRGLDCGRELLGGALKLTASLLDEVIGFVQGLDDLGVDDDAFLG